MVGPRSSHWKIVSEPFLVVRAMNLMRKYVVYLPFRRIRSTHECFRVLHIRKWSVGYQSRSELSYLRITTLRSILAQNIVSGDIGGVIVKRSFHLQNSLAGGALQSVVFSERPHSLR